jgi:cytochrome c oxidase subunit 2
MLLRRKHWGAVAVWITLSVIGVTSCSVENNFIRTPSMLAPNGPVAERIAGLSWFMIILGGLIFLGVMAYLAYALWGHRGYDLEDELMRPNQGTGIVLAWGVGFTALVLVVLFGYNLGVMRANNLMFDRQAGEVDDALVIDVIGHQWWWEVIYPELGFETANEIYIPVGQPVILRMVTEDVIHSLWVPELAGKLDLLPNQVNELVIMTDRAGEYWGECAEYCGTQHAKMKLLIVAQTDAEFAAWLALQQQVPIQPPDGLAFEGQQIFLGSACVYCHNIEGTNASGDLGPDLTHLASRQTLGAGILENTTGNLAGWIIDPQAIKPGNLMPPMDLSGPELQAILAYLATLE